MVEFLLWKFFLNFFISTISTKQFQSFLSNMKEWTQSFTQKLTHELRVTPKQSSN